MVMTTCCVLIGQNLAMVGETRLASPVTGSWSWVRLVARTGRKRRRWAAVVGMVSRESSSSSCNVIGQSKLILCSHWSTYLLDDTLRSGH